MFSFDSDLAAEAFGPRHSPRPGRAYGNASAPKASSPRMAAQRANISLEEARAIIRDLEKEFGPVDL